jgi:hypothetical protein
MHSRLGRARHRTAQHRCCGGGGSARPGPPARPCTSPSVTGRLGGPHIVANAGRLSRLDLDTSKAVLSESGARGGCGSSRIAPAPQTIPWRAAQPANAILLRNCCIYVFLACLRRDPAHRPARPKCSASCRRPKLAPWRRPPRGWVPRPQRSFLRPLLRPHPPPADPAPRHPLAAASQRMFAPSHRAVRVAAVAAVDPVGAAASKARPTARLAPAARAGRCPAPRLARRPPPCRQTPPRCCCARCAASKWSAPPCG